MRTGLEVLAGDRTLPISWAGAAAGYVGMAVVRFRLAEDLTAEGPIELKVQCGGRFSNTVWLPLL